MTEDNYHNSNSESHRSDTNKTWRRVKDLFDELGNGVRELVTEGNRRQLIVRKSSGDELFGLPLTIAAVLVLAALVLRLLPLLLIGVIVALVMRVQFVIAKDGSEPGNGPDVS